MIVPFFKDSLKIFVVMTLSLIVADFLATRAGLFIKAIAPHSNSEKKLKLSKQMFSKQMLLCIAVEAAVLRCFSK